MRVCLRVIVSGLTILSFACAGGKVTAPVVAEVKPIPPIPPKISPVPVYIGLGLVAAGVSKNCACGTGKRLKDLTYGSVMRLGYDFNNYFGIEARVLKTFLAKSFSTVTHYGLFLKPQYHISEQSNIYALLGYGHTVATGCKVKGDLSKNHFTYGAGLEYDFGREKPKNGIYSRPFDGQGDQEQGWGMWVDFQHMLGKEGVYKTNTNVATLGVTYDF